MALTQRKGMYRGGDDDDDDDVCFYMQPLFVSHAERCTVNRPVLKEDFTDHRETKASGCFPFLLWSSSSVMLH